MKVNPVSNVTFTKIVETFRSDQKGNPSEESRESVKEDTKDTYEKTITYTETVKVPKNSGTLQQVDYMI